MRDGATFGTFNGKDAWPSGNATTVAGEAMGRTVLQGPQRKWYKWDLRTKVVQDWIAGTRPNHGFIIYGTPPGKAAPFTSSESDQKDKRPILRLVLSLPDSDVAKLGRLTESDILWPQFLADCGKKAQEANEARTEKVFEERYLNRTINWTGTVDSTKRKLIGSGYDVNVRMDPTESAFGTYDLTLSVPDGLTDRILSLNKGQAVDFTAKFSRQGGLLLGHQLELLTVEPAKPPAQSPSKTMTPPSRKRR